VEVHEEVEGRLYGTAVRNAGGSRSEPCTTAEAGLLITRFPSIDMFFAPHFYYIINEFSYNGELDIDPAFCS
jgi:hypothetical protein